MNIRTRRFWMSISLAAGSLAWPVSSGLRAHDLPNRWSPGSNSTSSWNYLLDDCLDSPAWLGASRSASLAPSCLLSFGQAAAEFNLADASLSENAAKVWAEKSVPRFDNPNGCVEDFDSLLSRNSMARFHSEMACWVNEWERLQQQAGDEFRRDMQRYRDGGFAPASFAALPDEVLPPSPADYRTGHPQRSFAASAPAADELAMGDTCAFEAEYQATQSAAELLAKVESPDCSSNSRDFAKVLADVAAIEAASMDALSSSTDANIDATRCGGASHDLVVDPAGTGRPVWGPSRFAPGIVDEFMSQEMSEQNSHWLGGLGKAWRLEAAVRAAQAKVEPARSAEELADAIATAMLAPEDWMPPAPPNAVDVDAIANDTQFANFAQIIASQTLAFEEGARHQLDGLARSAAFSIQALRYLSAPLLHDASLAMPELGESLAAGMAWVEDAQCQLTAEMCGFDTAFRAGGELGRLALAGTQQSMDAYLALGSHLNAPPPVANPLAELYVIYTDADGQETAVPASLARAWNRPEADTFVDTNASNDIPGSVPGEAEGSVPEQLVDASNDTSGSVSLDWVALESEVLAMVARQLDAIGIACLQTADQLSDWADNQIASRATSANR